jgi:pyruvate dehydrogenase kinase 2/3/4
MRTGRGELLKDPATPILNTTATERILCQVASFIHHEMPIRLARRIKDLDQIPGMKDMTSVQAVKDIYISSFLSLIKEPAIQDDVVREALFARKLEVLYERHSAVLVQMAKGAYELRSQIQDSGGLNKKHDTLDFEHWQECHSFLDRFYMSRIGIRVLAGQYLALRRPPMENYIGLICQTTSPHQVVQLAVDDASYMCHSHFGAAPQVRIHGCLDMTFAYIPTQLHYILLELLKNAMRATVEHHGAQNITSWPPIQVIISGKVISLPLDF